MYVPEIPAISIAHMRQWNAAQSQDAFLISLLSGRILWIKILINLKTVHITFDFQSW